MPTIAVKPKQVASEKVELVSEMILDMAKILVQDAEGVRIQAFEGDGKGTVLILHVRSPDFYTIVGKDGRKLASLRRTLDLLSRKNGQNFVLHVQPDIPLIVG